MTRRLNWITWVTCPYATDGEQRHTEHWYCPNNGHCRRCGNKCEGNATLNRIWHFVVRLGRSS